MNAIDRTSTSERRRVVSNEGREGIAPNAAENCDGDMDRTNMLLSRSLHFTRSLDTTNHSIAFLLNADKKVKLVQR